MRLHRIPPSWRTISLLALLAVQPWVAAAQDATEDLSGFATEERAPSVALHHMIAASDPMAAEAGLAALRAGGNAVDAAIAVQAMLTLTEPESSGIGGSAYLVYFDKKSGSVFTYDGRETAPAAATETLFLSSDRSEEHTSELQSH